MTSQQVLKTTMTLHLCVDTDIGVLQQYGRKHTSSWTISWWFSYTICWLWIWQVKLCLSIWKKKIVAF